MVIGPGSESYELLRGIVERLPALPAPEWLDTKTQPIGALDVVEYLRQALDVARVGRARDRDRRPERAQPSGAGRRDGRGAGPQPTATDPDVGRGGAPGDRRRRRRRGHRAAPRRSPPQISLGLTTPTVVADQSGAELFSVRPRPLDAVLADAVDAAADEAEAPDDGPPVNETVFARRGAGAGLAARSWTRRCSNAG